MGNDASNYKFSETSFTYEIKAIEEPSPELPGFVLPVAGTGVGAGVAAGAYFIIKKRKR